MPGPGSRRPALDQGDIRNAAEKAWGATKRSTNALVLARTGSEPERTPETGTGLRLLEYLDEAVRQAYMVRRYYTRPGRARAIGHTLEFTFGLPKTNNPGRRPEPGAVNAKIARCPIEMSPCKPSETAISTRTQVHAKP